MKKKILMPFIALAFLLFAAEHSNAQDSFLGEIKLVGFNFTPRGWAACEGQLLPINQNQALFSLLGTIYGGDGRSTFALPDMRGRVPVGVGKTGDMGTIKQGAISNPAEMAAGNNKDSIVYVPGNIGMRYIICTAGIFPSRN
jgi:microcystin-dependent protein